MASLSALLSLVLPLLGHAHDHVGPINPELGVPGFPDCVRAHPELELSVEDAADDLLCGIKEAPATAVRIACIGDSITAGVRSSSAAHAYPQQLQSLLDTTHGQGAYSVTNLGACGSTMLKKGDSPFWKRPQYQALTSQKWDIVTILLGTNDAKDTSDKGKNNWQHDCGGPDHTTLEGCSFAEDYKAMIDLVKTLGTTSAGPKIYVMTVPLMQQSTYGMNQTVINGVYPNLIPLIQKANSGVLGPIDLYHQMGGVQDWKTTFPAKCVVNSSFAPCGSWCDKQSCDQCHPNDVGYAKMAKLVQQGLGLDKTSSSILV